MLIFFIQKHGLWQASQVLPEVDEEEKARLEASKEQSGEDDTDGKKKKKKKKRKEKKRKDKKKKGKGEEEEGEIQNKITLAIIYCPN